MDIIILPKGKDKKHHKILRAATSHFVNKLIGKRDAKKINTITIKLASSIDYGTSRGDCRETISKDGTYDIFIIIDATEPIPDMICTLAHEMVHAKQSVKSELTIDGEFWTWKGKKMLYKDAWYNDFTRQQQHDRLPWETEAYNQEMSLARGFFSKYFNSNY